MRADFNNEENIFEGVAAPGTPGRDRDNRLELKFLGRTTGAPEAASLSAAAASADYASLCPAIQNLVPHATQ